jgi:hypothetical protein
MPLHDPTRGRHRQALQAGGDALAKAANVRAPKLNGRMSQSWHVIALSDSEAVLYNSTRYASKQERRDWQVHPQGGAAHFLQLAVDQDADAVGEAIMGELFRE